MTALPDSFFYPPSRSTIRVARDCGLSGPLAVALSNLPARLAWAAYNRRRVPRRMLKARLDARRNPTSDVWVSGEQGAGGYRGGVFVGAAPGQRAGLEELIESIRHHEGDDIKIVVGDDLTGEYPDAVAQRDFPGIDFVRPKVAAGSHLCALRTLQPALLHLASTYDVPTILKVDPDSLLIGSGAFDLATERFAADPGLGALGTTTINAAGNETQYAWASWMGHPELRWSSRFRRLVRGAQANASPLRFAQAGAYFISRDTVRSAVAQGILPYKQPQWSLQVDDVIMGLVVQAAGFSVQSFGAPGEPVASDTNKLPLEPAELLEGGFKVIHSVRSTPAGLPEEEVRAFFRSTRA